MGTLTIFIACTVAFLIVAGVATVAEKFARLQHKQRTRVIWVPVDENLQPLEPQPATFDYSPAWMDYARKGGK